MVFIEFPSSPPSRSLPDIQYVLCAYARKFKYLLFVIKFGRASRMGILHRERLRDAKRWIELVGPRKWRSSYCFILLLLHFISVYIVLASIRCLFSVSRFRSVTNPAGVVPVSYHVSNTFSFYPLCLLTLILIFLLLSFDTSFLTLISLKV